MSPEFSNPQTTVSGINFTVIQREISRQLLIRQEAVRNFNQRVWPSLDRPSKNTNHSQIQASLGEDNDKGFFNQRVESLTGLQGVHNLTEQFLTPQEKEQLAKLQPCSPEEKMVLETLSDYLIDAAIEDLQKGTKEINLEV